MRLSPEENSPLASPGRLKLVLLLELPLLLPEDRPLIPVENEALCGEAGGEGGGCSTLTGD